MDLRLLCSVQRQDGETLGELRHVVFDPQTRQVTALVAQQTGFDGRAVIVPVSALIGADSTATYIDLTREQFDALEPYAFGRNQAPPPADVANEVESSDQEQEFFDVPDVPPIGAATGITTIAFTPIIDVELNLPEGVRVLDDGTEVRASDGIIGHVRHVLVSDDTRQITGLIVAGDAVKRDVQIPAEWIATVEPDALVLRVNTATVQAAEAE